MIHGNRVSVDHHRCQQPAIRPIRLASLIRVVACSIVSVEPACAVATLTKSRSAAHAATMFP